MPKRAPLKIDPGLAKLNLDMKIELVPVDSIRPNSYNSNRQSDHEFELLCRSIEEDGFTQPILVNQATREIVDGEHRWRAMKALGYAEVPAILTPIEQIEMMIATLRHNRARGSEDIQRTADVFKDLAEMGALDHAADSLLMSDVDMNFMVSMIPRSELNLRTDGMSYEETLNTLAEEKRVEDLKKRQKAEARTQDDQKYTVQLTFLQDEASVIGAVIGKKPAAGILKLCQWALAENL